MSKRWGGKSGASIAEAGGCVVLGLAVFMTPSEIASLDPYEGYPNLYNRFDMNMILHGKEELVKGQAYIRQTDLNLFLYPSKEYLEACSRTQFLHEILKTDREKWLSIVDSQTDALTAATQICETRSVKFDVLRLTEQNTVEKMGEHVS